MKTTFKIARTELQTLFYSPVAWLILVIFTVQSAYIFTDIVGGMVKNQSMGWGIYSATLSTFAGFRGLYTQLLEYLYLYIPLLTMGVMSRELSSGSIKMLYSSPLTDTQIILGKYLALMIYGAVLTGIVFIFGLYSIGNINSVDIPSILCGLLGIYLLICAYAAIGLFMSSLTSYAVVAAMGTLAIFAILSYVKGLGQDIAFVRDITYWLAISGRVNTFISGMVTSEDVLYFLTVITLFLGLCILKLKAGRQRVSWIANASRYAMLCIFAILVGYFSSKPVFKGYYDVTRTKLNTLTKSSQDVVSKLTGGLTIHTYTNMLDPNYFQAMPGMYKYDVQRFEQYLRFKPDLKMEYHYYYHHAENPQLDQQFPNLNDQQRMDTLTKLQNFDFEISPYSAISKQIDLSGEKFRFVRSLERESGQKTFLRLYDDIMKHPSEAEITAAFKRLVMKLPVVGFLAGHGERDNESDQDRGYKMITQEKTFRYALINQGFDFASVTLDRAIPDRIRILVIAEIRRPLSDTELDYLQQYIGRGGNLIIEGEPGDQEQMNRITEVLGVRFLPGMLVSPSEKFQSNLLLLKPTDAATAFSYYLADMRAGQSVLSMPTACALEPTNYKGFEITTLFSTDTSSWNELETKNFIDDTVRFHPAAGEVKKAYPTVLALSRQVDQKEQKIIITGDADWLSNSELGMQRKDVRSGNFSLINGAFFWLSDNEVPIDMRRPQMPDTSLRVGKSGWAVSNILLRWGLSVLLAILGLFVWIRRRGR